LIELQESSGMENRRLIEVPVGISWIRIAENHADGWQYRLESTAGKWLDVARAKDKSMLLENPQPNQTSRIEMRYDPPLRRVGSWVSGLSLLVLLLGHWLSLRSRGSVFQTPSPNPSP
jgi:hypothetical protein